MGTRSTTHFTHGDEKKPTAIIYRHGDGYPEAAGVDIHKFLNECKALKDSRLNDPSYLAAKYVVFLADMFNVDYDFTDGKMKEIKPASRLEFISVGVLMQDPGNIEYRYVINCGKIGTDGLPTVTCYAVDYNYETKKTSKKKVAIPLEEVAS